jgi:hypothetical protein
MRISRRKVLGLGSLGLTATALQALGFACSGTDEATPDELPSDVASTWFEQIYDVVKSEGTPPPQASRVYGIAGVALYESVVAGGGNRRSLAGQLNGLDSLPSPGTKDVYWPAAANAALAETMRRLYPRASQASREALDALESRTAGQHAESASQTEVESGSAYGRKVAAAILDWAGSDGFSTKSGAGYNALNLPGAWKPTPPRFSAPLEPGWGDLRPMVLSSGAEIPAAGHVSYSKQKTSDFYFAALDVYEVGRRLTDEQKLIADYWSDGPIATGTPPGHWMAIVSQISRNDRLSLLSAAEAYARTGIAVHDAFICCWQAKYAYNLQRPVTYINENIDAHWSPFIATPNFPSYTSGHSTQSGAVAYVLTDMFGRKAFRDTTHVDHGLMPRLEPRTFRSFDEASAEAAVSRLYGGIHFAFDNDDGLASGTAIGKAITERVRFRS